MTSNRKRFIIDRESLNVLNGRGCSACGRKFSLGEPVVVACGAWEDGPKVIHENEAVYDPAGGIYVERRCHAANAALPRIESTRQGV